MSLCVSEQIAIAVAAELNTLALGFTAHYKQLPDVNTRGLNDDVYAIVRDIDEEFGYESRSQTKHEYFIEICLRQRAAVEEVEALTSALKHTAETINDYWRFRPLANSAARFVRLESRDVDEETLRNRLLVKITSVLVFRAWKGT